MKDLSWFDFQVAGPSYRSHADRDALYNAANGREFEFKREPSNKYDPHAVMVMLGNYHVGYVPRTLSRLVTDLMHAGRVVQVVKYETRPSHSRNKPGFVMMRVTCSVRDETPPVAA